MRYSLNFVWENSVHIKNKHPARGKQTNQIYKERKRKSQRKIKKKNKRKNKGEKA